MQYKAKHAEKIEVICEEAGVRLDKFLVTQIDFLSRSQIQDLIAKHRVSVNDQVIDNPAFKTKPATFVIDLSTIEDKSSDLKPFEYPLKIVFEDEYLMVINKDAGLTVHPGAGNFNETLANALVSYAKDKLSNLAGSSRPGIVHRLDKDTSGLIIIAKDDTCHQLLSKAMAEREIKRYYLALTFGCPELKAGTIKTHIAKHHHDHTKMVITRANGKEAITHYVVKESILNNKFSLLECKLDTGRTHQIRVHLNYKGYPVVGDQSYKDAQQKYLVRLSPNIKELVSSFKRQALHAYKLEFTHPITEELMEFEIDLPEDIKKLWHELEIS